MEDTLKAKRAKREPLFDAIEPSWIEELVPHDPFDVAGPRPRPRFISGDASEDRLTVRYYRHAATAELVARVSFGPGCEGPPEHAHGGAIAGVFDEVLGASAWVAGHRVVAARLTTDFRAVVPIGLTGWVRTRIREVDGRKVFLEAALLGVPYELFAEATGLFVALDEDRWRAFGARSIGVDERRS